MSICVCRSGAGPGGGAGPSAADGPAAGAGRSAAAGPRTPAAPPHRLPLPPVHHLRGAARQQPGAALLRPAAHQHGKALTAMATPVYNTPHVTHRGAARLRHTATVTGENGTYPAFTVVSPFPTSVLEIWRSGDNTLQSLSPHTT